MGYKTIPKMLTHFTRGLKRFFLFSVITAAVAALMGFLTPLIVGFAIDSVIGDKIASMPAPVMYIYRLLAERTSADSKLLICAALAALSAIIAAAFNYLSHINMAKGAERMIKKLRDSLFAHTQSLPFAWHTKNLTGDIIQRCTSDVETTRRFVFQQLIEVLRTVILIITSVAIMFSLNVLMAAVVTVFIPLILWYTAFFFKRISHKFLACDEAEGELMVRVQENLTGVRVVRAFGRERHETERFDEKNIGYTNKWLSLGFTFGLFWGLGDTVSTLQLLSVIVFGSVLAANGSLSFGGLLVFISYTLTLMWPVRQLGRILSEMSKTGVSLKRIKEIFDAQAETEEPDSKRPPIDRDIEFRNVSFTYDEHPVLSDVSFTVKSGTTFGILGATGSGKSTITYLLNRLYDLPEGCGAITIGGVDISCIDKSYLRRSVGLVLQEPFLFSKTIFENIDIASRGRDIERVREKAMIAAVDDSIMSFSGGYDTIVGERGVTLSGGQKQRIAIARTLMMNAPVMVFDDSMSSLDMETDAKIRDALREDTAGSTVILISHRISTLMTADTIMVLENGRVAEIGSHAELVEKNGLYRRVYDLQSNA
ncbi:MAG: ABC transporter ATP-binding protein/permease [Oscillospiraceae bacterium]|jgi:ATP-binding cassette subfamily B protein|nr:ABC transporter ATP-binding protein/permease [Oscillospiraceae bacterium]